MSENVFDRDELPAGVPARVISPWRVAAFVSLGVHLAIGIVAIGVAASRPVASIELPSDRTYPLPDPDAPIIVELPAMSDVATTPMNVPSPASEQAGGANVAHVDE